MGQSVRRISACRDEHKVAVAKLLPTSTVYQDMKNRKNEIDFYNTKRMSNNQ